MITLKQIKELGSGDIISYKGDEALQYVKEDGQDLRYVKEQTPEICFAAVNKNGCALQYVREQTPEICFAAVEADEGALQYVDESIFKEEKRTVTLELTEEQIEQISKLINN